MSLLIRWAASAIALVLVTKLGIGVGVAGWGSALIAALIIGLVNATIGSVLKALTLPIGCLTLGLSSLIINALMFWLAAMLVDGFTVAGFIPALIGSIIMSLVSTALDSFLTKVLTSSGDNR